MIETSQTDLIWLDQFCILSSKEARRTGQGMNSIVLDTLIFSFSGMIQQRRSRGGRKKKKIKEELILAREESENRR